MTIQELDVRQLPKPEKHPTIFAAYTGLEVGDSVDLINDHDPRHLRDEFETEYPNGFDWSYIESERRAWRIRITKLAATALPRVLTNTAALIDAAPPETSGAIWNLPGQQRDLDSNVIQLPPGGSIDPHAGADLDVLIHVLDGSGHLVTENGRLELSVGDVVWLPSRSIRGFAASDQGIRYLTVHRRRQGLVIELASPPPAPV